MSARRSISSALIALLLSFRAENAAAYDAYVDATFDAQFYNVPSPYGNPILRRRRFTETLSLRVVGLEGRYDPKGPELFAVARLRLDADFGQDESERAVYPTDIARSTRASSIDERRFVPGLQQAPFDIMTAYVEGRRYFRGLVGFRAGRQYVVDALGFWSFDGGLVRLTTPAYFNVEAYGGFEQRGGLPMLATSRFEADGVMRGDRTNLGPNVWPSYLEESRLAPAYGVAVESSGLDFLSTRLTYRRVINRDVVNVSPFPDARGAFVHLTGDRVSTERLGWALTATAKDVGNAHGELVYDLLTARLSGVVGSVDWFATPALVVGADYDYFLPTFDGDSIWNWFTHFGTTTIRGRAQLTATRYWAFAGSFGARRFETEGNPNSTAVDGTRSSLADVLGVIDATFKRPELRAVLRLMDEHGDRGLRRGADVSLQRFFDGKTYEVATLLSLYRFEDPLRQDASGVPIRNATSATYVLRLGYRPFPLFRTGFEWEHSMSDLLTTRPAPAFASPIGHRFRALFTFGLTGI
jgi:hypothetical protein